MIELDLLDRNGDFLRTIEGVNEVGWVEPHRGPGNGNLAIHYSHTDYSHFNYFRLIRCYLDRAARPDGDFLWMITEKPKTVASQAGDADEMTIISGPGAEAIFGMGQDPGGLVIADNRRGEKAFGWVTLDWDVSAWWPSVSWGPALKPIAWVGMSSKFQGSWPDPLAHRIWSEALLFPNEEGGYYHEPGYRWHRRVINSGSFSGVIKLYFAYDNGVGLYWDGEFLGQWDQGLNGFQTHEVELEMEANTDYVLACEMRNGDPAFARGVIHNPGGILYSFIEEDEEGGNKIVRWRSQDGVGLWTDEQPLGVTYGYVVGRLLEDAQDRGCFPMVTWDFTDELDSNGDPWEVQLPIDAYNDGVYIGEVIRQGWQKYMGDSYMNPQFVLQLFNSRGTDRSATVQLEDHNPDPYANDVISSRMDSKAPGGTVARLGAAGTSVSNSFGWAVDAAAVAEWGRLEVAATYGTAKSIWEIVVAAQGLLQDLKGSNTQVIELTDESPNQPYRDFWNGDSVGARESRGGSFLSYRALQLSVTQDEARRVDFTLDVERKL